MSKKHFIGVTKPEDEDDRALQVVVKSPNQKPADHRQITIIHCWTTSNSSPTSQKR